MFYDVGDKTFETNFNNGTHDTSKHVFYTFRDVTSQTFPFQNGTSHRDSIFTPWNRAKLEKNHFFLPKNIFRGTNLYSLCIFMVLKRNKKFVCSIFRDVLFQNQLQQPPGELILLKFCQNVSNR